MVYVNMGHNGLDKDRTKRELSFPFANEARNKFILNALLWLGVRQP